MQNVSFAWWNFMKSLILYHYHFCPIAWHLCSMEDTKKMGTVQYRALKFVYSDFTTYFIWWTKRKGLNKTTVLTASHKAFWLRTICYITTLGQHIYIVYCKKDCVWDTRNIKSSCATSLQKKKKNKTKNSKYGLNSFKHQGATLRN